MRETRLRSLLRLRRLAEAEARRQLADRIVAENAAEHSVREAEVAIRREHTAVLDPSADDRAVEAFGAWLPNARAAVAGAEAVRVNASAQTGKARAELAAARASLEAVEAALLGLVTAAKRRLERKRDREIAESMQRSRDGSSPDAH